MSNTMILFLSDCDPTRLNENTYTTDEGFKVTGAQTNEAPVRYAIRRLEKDKKGLKKIIVLTTPKAKETALEMFKKTVKSESRKTDIKSVDISDSVTVAELLREILDELFIDKPDSVIIDTTGGPRNAVTAITLLTRFLIHNDIKIEFSIYSDYATKCVTDTNEIDEMFDLLDAVNIFAITGNTSKIKDLFTKWRLQEKKDFFKAADNFYNSMLLCRASIIKDDVDTLKKAIEKLRDTEYPDNAPKFLIFRKLILTTVEKKMTFLQSENLMPDFILWCSDNHYLQQAVTFLNEDLAKKTTLTIFDRYTLKLLRNSINHANEDNRKDPITDKNGADITDKVIEKVNSLLKNANEVKKFVKDLIAEIKR